MLEKVLGGSAKQFRYTVDSGVSVTSLWMGLWGPSSGSQVMVSSHVTQESGSGLGKYYTSITLPTTPGVYAAEFHALYGTVAGGGDAWWLKRKRFQIVLEEVD